MEFFIWSVRSFPIYATSVDYTPDAEVSQVRARQPFSVLRRVALGGGLFRVKVSYGQRVETIGCAGSGQNRQTGIIKCPVCHALGIAD